MNIAIIPARGGSKRIPQKNIKLFHGKPMLQYSIEAALSCKLFDQIIVSTDSEEIAVLAKKLGATVPSLRPAKLADDYTPMGEVLLHTINNDLDQTKNYKYACFMLATAPFMQPEHIQEGLNLIQEKQVTSVVPVTTFQYPIFRALKIDQDHSLKMFWPEHEFTRSNDLEEAYHDAGQFYWVDIQKYKVAPRIFAKDAAPLIIPRHLVQDIDTLEDWKRAEMMYTVLVTPHR